MLGWRLPRRPGTAPPSTHAEPWLSRQVRPASISDTSTCRPRAVAVVGEVEGDRALVAVQPEVVRRLAFAPRRTPGARVVAAVGPLHLDHVRSEVAEQHRRQRPGQDAGEVGDQESVERRHPPGTLTPMRTLVVSDL